MAEETKKAKKDRKAKKAEKPKKHFVHYIVYLACVIGTITLVLIAGIGYIMSQPLPDISIEAIERRSSRPSTILANDGSVLAIWHGDTERLPMQTEDLPQVMFDATVAIEDQSFFDHSGLDVRGIVRAVQRNVQAGEIVEGGSTITQQLMKMMYAGEDQSLMRKVEEAILASRVEMERDKRDILAAYLNMAFFGQGAYGISAAADIFFDIEPEDLTIAQAATLAGVLHMPSAYRPHEDPEPLEQRRNLVLAAMRDQELIDQAEYIEARNTPLEIAPRSARVSDVRYPFFVDLVQRELPNLIDEERIAQGGLYIYTTLDPAIQEAAEGAASTFNDSDDEDDPTVSLVTMRHSDGAILALIGGKDWDEKQFNVAVQARRQPGSAFKPLTLIAALESGRLPGDTFDASPFEVMVKDEMWNVSNYGGATSASPLSLRDATISSINTVYARLIIEVGPDEVVQLAHDLGFAAPMEPDPALSLGGLRYGVSPLEMARAYTTIAKDGVDVNPRVVNWVVAASAAADADDEAEILYAAPDEPEQQRIFSAETGREVRGILREAVTAGTGRRADIPSVDVAGKTGTTQNYHDAWFVGWAEGVTTAVWMGFPEAQIEMRDIRGRNVSGGSYPAQIFHDYMISAMEERVGIGLSYLPETVDWGGDYYFDILDIDIPTLEEIGRAP